MNEKLATELLSELRWSADRVVTTPFGERVWLKECEAGGITDCCNEAEPCSYHSRITHSAIGGFQ